MPREKYRDRLTIREGGAYYSFSRQRNSDSDPQIGLEQGTLITGFSGADFGFVTSLGDAPLDKVELGSHAVAYLAEFVARAPERVAPEQQRRTGAGFTDAGQT